MESHTLEIGDILIVGMHVVTVDRVTKTRAYAGYWAFLRDGFRTPNGKVGFRQYGDGRSFSVNQLCFQPTPAELEKREADRLHFENVGKLANEIVFTNWRELSREKLLKVKAILEEPE